MLIVFKDFTIVSIPNLQTAVQYRLILSVVLIIYIRVGFASNHILLLYYVRAGVITWYTRILC